jgi:hypothetical protein
VNHEQWCCQMNHHHHQLMVALSNPHHYSNLKTKSLWDVDQEAVGIKAGQGVIVGLSRQKLWNLPHNGPASTSPKMCCHTWMVLFGV